MLAPYIRGDVLEVGAGIGANTPLLRGFSPWEWTCLEPDAALLARARVEDADLAGGARHVSGTLATLAPGETFDKLVYLDVLEHIEDDSAELELAARRLKPGRRVALLAPAHQRLFTELDRAIGHHRRYDRASLSAAGRAALQREALFYLDSIGLCASLVNRVLLHRSAPTLGQIHTWDRLLVPVSRVLDPLLLRRVGKAIVAVWRR